MSHSKTTPDPTLLLRPEEKLLSVEEVQKDPPGKPLSALEALQLLADVEKGEDIGTKGPLIASRTTSKNRDQPALRLYEALFGRDSLISAYFLLDQFPALARATLLRLAELQGTTSNMASEEEPGKIIHEARNPDDPIAKNLTTTRGWQWPYYGSIDATPLFIIVLAQYVRRHNARFLKETYTDRTGHTQPLAHSVRQAVGWILKKMENNPEGLVESEPLHNNSHHSNQVWKDSPDSYHHADGSLVDMTNGVSSIEVQAYAYDALLEASELLAEDWHRPADQLRTVIMEKFWLEDERGGYFALGTDRDDQHNLRVLAVRTSNMGHVLNSRLLEGNDSEIVRRKRLLVQTLSAPDLLTTYGIRTLSSLENRYRPTSYHNGSVWPWDTYYISLGLLRQGFTAEAHGLWEKIKIIITATKLFPEYVSGENTPVPTMSSRIVKVFDTRYQFENTLEQPPQEIQAWTVAATVALDL